MDVPNNDVRSISLLLAGVSNQGGGGTPYAVPG